MSQSPRLTTTPAPLEHQATSTPLSPTLFLLTLSPSNKAEIFASALSTLSPAHHSSSLILQNLTAWNPSAAAQFTQRSASTILDTPFRLIFPQSALPYFDETGLYVRQYLAVSYCWRSEPLLPDGSQRHDVWPIGKNFVDAILAEKDDMHPRVGIWMDQLCIDQTSSVDKQKSVAAMDIIYKSCIRLVVLLDDVFLSAAEAALHEKYDVTKRTFNKTWRPESEEERRVFASFYTNVNRARWWERAWCFHEFNVHEPWSERRKCELLHNATFILNAPEGRTVSIKWVNLELIMMSGMYALPDNIGDVLGGFKGQGIFTGRGGASSGDGEREDGWRTSLMAKHNGVSQKGCMFLTDRLSIMINMCGLGLAYVGRELRSREEVLYHSVLLALAAGETYPLSMMDGKSITLNGRPTWLAPSTVATDTSIPRFKLGGIKGIRRVSEQEIELDMLFLTGAWEKVEQTDLTPTFEIFPETIPTTQPARHISDLQLKATMNDHPDTLLDVPRRRFLAGCIMNGHSFTARLWTQLKREVVVPNYNVGVFKDLAPNPSLQTAAQIFMAKLLPISALLCIPPPSSFTLEDAALFLTWLTDPRSMYYISVYTYRVQCTLDGRRAFVTAMAVNEHFGDGPPGELRAAVPTDLLDATCIPLRVWFLRPGKGEKGEDRWRLVGKALLLGEPDLMSEAKGREGREDAVVSLKRTVVSG